MRRKSQMLALLRRRRKFKCTKTHFIRSLTILCASSALGISTFNCTRPQSSNATIASRPENDITPEPLKVVDRHEGQPYVEVLDDSKDGVSYYRQRTTDVQFEMVFIHGGRFDMGSPPSEAGRMAAEGPVHSVQVNSFWMSKYELPFEVLWAFKADEQRRGGLSPYRRRILEVGPYSHYYDFPFVTAPSDRHPILGMTQYGAQQLCRWLTLRTGHTYRLPTEAEWEYAARAGGTGPYTLAGNDRGDDVRQLTTYAWFGAPSVGPHVVGQANPNAWGLYDMYGNVAEWTLDGWSDDYSAFKETPSIDPWVPRAPRALSGVARGGDWASPAADLRSAARREQIDVSEMSSLQPWGGPEHYNSTEPSMHVGIRLVSPAEADHEPAGKPPRATYLTPTIYRDVAHGVKP
jgi:formylglycine-generating enzyme required for sulfatase activity